MEESEFIHRNRQIYLAFAEFDSALLKTADRSDYEFRDKCGTVRGRSLTLRRNALEKMICFDIINSIHEVDFENLQVNLGWGVWLHEAEERRKPFWFLKRDYFTGSINELPELFDRTLTQMVVDLDSITEQVAREKGEYHS